MVADEAGLQVGGMLDKAGPVGNAIPEGMRIVIFRSLFSNICIQFISIKLILFSFFIKHEWLFDLNEESQLKK
jgi:hypothetical protein